MKWLINFIHALILDFKIDSLQIDYFTINGLMRSATNEADFLSCYMRREQIKREIDELTKQYKAIVYGGEYKAKTA